MAAVYNTTAPDRWLGCPALGEIVDDTFLPMKTLLDDDITVPSSEKFTPKKFLESIQARKLNIGLLINLSFSTRYYEKDDLDETILYKQIACRGHKEAPQPKEREEFINVCRKFISEQPRKLIAVHCTHGFNRTGFMICHFLCRERDWSLEAAVMHFASKRPPGIYKQDYLDELAVLHSTDDDPVPEAAPRPQWDLDETQMMNMLNGDYENSDDDQTKSKNEFYEGIHDVHLVSDEALRRKIYAHCCNLLDFSSRNHSLSFPGAQPVSMDMENIQLLAAERYMVSWKADGERYMLYIQDEENIFFLTRSLKLWRVYGLYFPQLNDLRSHLTDTLLDGEMVTEVFDGNRIPRYLIYDVICLNGTITAQQSFDKRLGKIQGVIIEARRKAKQAQIIPREGEPFKVADKAFYKIHDSKRTWEMKVTHEKDGLIFQPVDKPYVGGTCLGILKWKPPHLNSMDFKMIIREERQNGCLPELQAQLFVSNRKEPLFSFRLSKEYQSFKQYHNKIVEMTREKNKWNVIRERTDKLHANSLETIEAVRKSIVQPVTEAYLFQYITKIPRQTQQQPQSQQSG